MLSQAFGFGSDTCCPAVNIMIKSMIIFILFHALQITCILINDMIIMTFRGIKVRSKFEFTYRAVSLIDLKTQTEKD